MLVKALTTLGLLSISLVVAYYVYPTHPALVWVLLAICWACYLLGLRAQFLFKNRDQGVGPAEPTGINH